MHYYQWNIGDYMSHTRHLSPMEDLVYRRLLDTYYLQEHPLNACSASVARQIGLRDFQAEVDVVLAEFFELTDAGWINSRADREITQYHAKIEQASRAGKASAERRSNVRSTDVQPTNNQEPITIKHKPKIKQEPLTLVPGWLSLEDWTAFVDMRKKIKKPMTDYAMKLMLGKLDKMHSAGIDVKVALHNSIVNGWQDVYEPKRDKVEHPVAGKTLINGRDPVLAEMDKQSQQAKPMPENLKRIADMMRGAIKPITPKEKS